MVLKATVVNEGEQQTAWPSRKRAAALKTLPAEGGIVVKTVQAWRGVDSTDKVSTAPSPAIDRSTDWYAHGCI